MAIVNPISEFDLKNMRFHEVWKIVFDDEITVYPYLIITKVVGGWLYDNGQNIIFVPYNSINISSSPIKYKGNSNERL